MRVTKRGIQMTDDEAKNPRIKKEINNAIKEGVEEHVLKHNCRDVEGVKASLLNEIANSCDISGAHMNHKLSVMKITKESALNTDFDEALTKVAEVVLKTFPNQRLPAKYAANAHFDEEDEDGEVEYMN